MDTLAKHLSEPPPFYGAAAARLPAPLLPVLQRALAKRPEERYGSCTEMRQALAEARASLPDDAAEPGGETRGSAIAVRSTPARTTVLPRRRAATPALAAAPPPVPPPVPPPPVPPPLTPPKVTRPESAAPPTPEVAPPPLPPSATKTPPSVRVPTPSPGPPPRVPARVAAERAALETDRTYVELPVLAAGAPRPLAPAPVPAAASPVPGRRASAARGLRAAWPLLVILAGFVVVAALVARLRAPATDASRDQGAPVTAPSPRPSLAGPAASPDQPEAASTSAAPKPAAPGSRGVATPVPTPAPPRRPVAATTPPPVSLASAAAASPTPIPEAPAPTPVPPPRSARLELAVRPGAVVEVDGQRLGKTPLAPLELEPGLRKIQLLSSGFWGLRRQLRLEAGTSARLDVDLYWEGIAWRPGEGAPYQLDRGKATPELDPVIRHLADGELEAALARLAPLAAAVSGKDADRRRRARVEFYLGVVTLELGRQAEAATHFLAAIESDGRLRPREGSFPLRVRAFFEQARKNRP
jgi:hypothetical protein